MTDSQNVLSDYFNIYMAKPWDHSMPMRRQRARELGAQDLSLREDAFCASVSRGRDSFLTWTPRR